MFKSKRTANRTIMISAAMVLSGLVGAGLERKLDVIPLIKRFLQENLLTSLQIDSDPNLENYSEIPKVTTPPRGRFLEWQVDTRKRILKAAGSDVIPKASIETQYRVLEETELDNGLVRKLIAFETFDQSEIPAYLHLPAGQAKLPAILVIPGHVPEGHSGIEQTSLMKDSYQHAAAMRLAEQGFVTLTPELRGFGYLGAAYKTEHNTVAYNALLEGTSYKWISLRDIGYAMRLLRQLDRVDARRTGVTGASYGGELAIGYSALDTEVQAVVFQSFGGAIGLRNAVRRLSPEQPYRHYCHILPKIDRMIAYEHWLWLLVPRPTLGIRGTRDRPFSEEAISIYQQGAGLAGSPPMPLLMSFEGGHEFFVEPAIEFFRKEL